MIAADRAERCAACGRPTYVGEDFDGPCVHDSDLACAMWHRDDIRTAYKHAADEVCRALDVAERSGWLGAALTAIEMLRLDDARAQAVVVAAKALRDSGYDGPFMGEAVQPLFAALAAYEREAAR